MTIKQPTYGFNAWEDYEKWESTCPDCNWTGLLSSTIFELETDLITSLRCPECDRKLALITNEATIDEIRALAAKGSEKAIKHLKINESSPS